MESSEEEADPNESGSDLDTEDFSFLERKRCLGERFLGLMNFIGIEMENERMDGIEKKERGGIRRRREGELCCEGKVRGR